MSATKKMGATASVLKFTPLAIALALGASSFAQAETGTVTFKGNINTTPCSIAGGQSGLAPEVDFGSVSASSLNKDQVAPQTFTIQLENCDITTLKTVTTTFAGRTIDKKPTMLDLTSANVTGAGIEIQDTTTNKALEFGKPSAPAPLDEGMNKLNFKAVLKKADAATDVTPGDFTASANFTLAYQ